MQPAIKPRYGQLQMRQTLACVRLHHPCTCATASASASPQNKALSCKASKQWRAQRHSRSAFTFTLAPHHSATLDACWCGPRSHSATRRPSSCRMSIKSCGLRGGSFELPVNYRVFRRSDCGMIVPLVNDQIAVLVALHDIVIWLGCSETHRSEHGGRRGAKKRQVFRERRLRCWTFAFNSRH